MTRSSEPAQEFYDPADFAVVERIEDEQYWHVHRRRVLADELRRADPGSSARYLEIGCGNGSVATYLNERGFRVDYADVHGEALERSRARARARLGPRADSRRFLRLDVTRSSPPEPYDGILLFDVLEHLPDDAEVLRRLRDSLEPRRGTLLLTVPAYATLWSPWDDLQRHKRRYRRSDLVEKLEASGFRVERSTYFFAPLVPAALGMKALRAVRRSLGLQKGERPSTSGLFESRSSPVLNKALLAILAPERRLLAGRVNLPFGTSVLCRAKPGRIV